MNPLKPPPKLKGLHFTLEEALKAREENRLLSLALFVPSACNLRCIYCYEDAGKSQPGELTLEDYERVIKEARDLGAETVWIPGSGEPIIWPHLPEFLKLIVDAGLIPVIFTNTTFKDDYLPKLFYDSGASVVAKRNSLNAETQNMLAGRPWAYDKIQRGWDYLLDPDFNRYEEMENGVIATRLAAETVIVRQNAHEMPDLQRYSRQKKGHFYGEALLNKGRALQHPELWLTEKQTEAVFRRCLEIDQKEFGYTWEPRIPYIGDKCIKLFHNITVDSLGDVRPCCGCKISLGNIKEKSLVQIMKSDQFQRIRHLNEYVGDESAPGFEDGFYYGCAAIREPVVRELIGKNEGKNAK